MSALELIQLTRKVEELEKKLSGKIPRSPLESEWGKIADEYFGERFEFGRSNYGAIKPGEAWDAALELIARPLHLDLLRNVALLERAMKALETVMNQPFQGSWDDQAVFVSQEICGIRKALRAPAPGEKEET